MGSIEQYGNANEADGSLRDPFGKAKVRDAPETEIDDAGGRRGGAR
jgi:hypothetical protein